MKHPTSEYAPRNPWGKLPACHPAGTGRASSAGRHAAGAGKLEACPTARVMCLAPRRGFTFIEVMFAVIVLGVGVTMIAAMLPVAIQTTQETRENAAGSATLEAGFHLLEQVYEDGGGMPAPPTGGPVTWPARNIDFTAAFQPTALAQTLGNRVLTSDPTFMWLPFYDRDGENPPKVALVGVRSRNIDQFPIAFADPAYGAYFNLTGAALPAPARQPSAANPDVYPLPVTISTLAGSNLTSGSVDFLSPDRIRISGRNGPLPSGGTFSVSDDQARQAAVEGAAVVVVDNVGRLRVYRLGPPTSEAELPPEWQLAPDAGLDAAELVDVAADTADFAQDTFNGTGQDFGRDEISGRRVNAIGAGNAAAGAYLVGRMLEDPSLPWNADTNPYVGPAAVVRVLDGAALR